MGDLHHVTELGPAMSEGVKHLAEITSVQPSSVANGHVETFKGDAQRRCRNRNSSPVSVCVRGYVVRSIPEDTAPELWSIDV